MLWETVMLLRNDDEQLALESLKAAMEGDDDIINAQMRLLSGEDDR
jgi:hypothetical protein